MKQFLKALVVIAGIISLQGCKKGEDDPFISLSSRKARVEGTWHLQSGTQIVEIRDSSGTNTQNTYEFAEPTVTFKEGQKQATENHNLNLTFSKKGTVEISQFRGKGGSAQDINFNASGTWDFEDGTGKGKTNRKKENVFIQITKVTIGYSAFIPFFNKGGTMFRYRIRELRKDKMVLVCENEVVGTTSKSTYKVSAVYTFVQ